MRSCDFFASFFPQVYAYTSESGDIGNSDLKAEVPLHFSFFFRALRRVMKPGRVVILHCQQIVRMKRAGGQGLYDFRGLLIRLGIRAGFVYDYDWLIRKGPQSQSIRTKSRSLSFTGFESDRTVSRGAMGDYLIKYIVPGENAVPVNNVGELTRDDWIDLAEGCWDDIWETDTLNVKAARSPEDTRHICALQIKLIERCVKLYTNPGEIVFSPFAGIGSEIVTALKLERRGYGIELKKEYHAQAIINCERAIKERQADKASLLPCMA